MTPTSAADTDWFTEARFGLFVHWGLYSLAARHEWVKLREHLTDEHYDRYLEQFRADRYDPAQWAADAKAAGMRYAILTSKHHEGFCLWDSALTEYKATNTPAGRDLLAEFVTAFRAAGLRVGFYHSMIDWHHPDYPLDWMHPAWRSGVEPGGDLPSYVEYLHGQVEELVTAHHPDVLWFDFSFPEFPPEKDAPGKGRADWQSARLVERIRELDSDVLINDRLDLPGSADFVTPEEMAPYAEPSPGERILPWESCRTLNGSWGYAPSFQQWLDAGQVLRLLVDGVAKNGNLLLNVGPTGRGEFEPRARRLLAEVGDWMRLHGESIHGAGVCTSVRAPVDCRLTQSGERVFLHLFSWPAGNLVVEGLADRLRYASFLHDAAEVPFVEVRDWVPDVPHRVAPGPEGSVVLTLPARRPESALPVIELSLRP